MLHVEQLQYTYQPTDDSRSMSLHFDFSLPQGDILAVLGPSGAGKSTLLGLLAGFIEQESGIVSHHGERIDALPPHQRPLSVLFQHHNLFPHLSVGDNIGLGITPTLKLNPQQRDTIARACGEVGLAGMEDRLPATLSGGQQQRVALARSLVRERPLLLLDEPFSALDPALRKEMLAQVKTLARDHQTSVIMVTHSPNDARAIADSIAYIESGTIRCFGNTEQVLSDPLLRDYLG